MMKMHKVNDGMMKMHKVNKVGLERLMKSIRPELNPELRYLKYTNTKELQDYFAQLDALVAQTCEIEETE